MPRQTTQITTEQIICSLFSSSFSNPFLRDGEDSITLDVKIGPGGRSQNRTTGALFSTPSWVEVNSVPKASVGHPAGGKKEEEKPLFGEGERAKRDEMKRTQHWKEMNDVMEIAIKYLECCLIEMFAFEWQHFSRRQFFYFSLYCYFFRVERVYYYFLYSFAFSKLFMKWLLNNVVIVFVSLLNH